MNNYSARKVWIIFLAALALRVIWIATLNNNVDVWGDWWDELGWRLATGQGFWVQNPWFSHGVPFYAWRSPGFPFLLSLVYRIFGHSFLAAKIVLAILNSGAAVLLYLLGRTLIGKREGVAAGLIYAFYPTAIFFTGYLAPDNIFTILLLTTVLFLVFAEKTGKRHLFFLAGIFLGAGVLSRSLFLVILPTVFLWLRIRNRKVAVPATLIVFLGCLLVMVPWTVRNYRVCHSFILTSTEGGIVCYIANNPHSLSEPSGYWNPGIDITEHLAGMSEVQIDHYWYREAFRFIRDNPKEYLRLCADRFTRFWRLYPHTFSGPGEAYTKRHVIIALLTMTPIFAAFFVGLCFSFRRWRDFLLFYLIIVVWSLPVILFFKTVLRYREAIMPYVILLAGYAVCRFFVVPKDNNAG
ncbi:MAG: glycosyltransferase family 39 protein [Candidatus Ratteibacteria bacterium]|jgi:4-amino-4-deoxy-L-arabinose transferase-like glycosyltransferase